MKNFIVGLLFIVASAGVMADDPLPQVASLVCSSDDAEPAWRILNPGDGATDGARMLVVPTALLVSGATCATLRAQSDDLRRFVNFRWVKGNSAVIEVAN